MAYSTSKSKSASMYAVQAVQNLQKTLASQKRLKRSDCVQLQNLSTGVTQLCSCYLQPLAENPWDIELLCVLTLTTLSLGKQTLWHRVEYNRSKTLSIGELLRAQYCKLSSLAVEYIPYTAQSTLQCLLAFYAILSISEARISLTILLGWLSLNLNTLSTTDSSVAVVSKPQNADQSLQISPAPTTSLPLLTVPATRGTWRRDESSSKSSTDVCGCTCKQVICISIPACEQNHLLRFWESIRLYIVFSGLSNRTSGIAKDFLRSS